MTGPGPSDGAAGAEPPAELSFSGPRPLRGRLRVPGDKSISHRALLFAALASGTSRLWALADGDDVARSRAAIEGLGVKVRDGAGSPAEAVVAGERADPVVIVRGAGFDGLAEPEAVIDCGNSGTSIRLLAGLLAGRPFHSVLTGDASIARRPMGRVVDPLRLMGARIDGRDGGRLAPLAIRGGGLTGMRHELAVASAQVKTALLLAGLQAAGATEVTEPALSRDHTERLLPAMGAVLEAVPGGVRVEPAGGGALRPIDLAVPGDPSAAAFFVVGACVTPGSDLVVEDVCLNPTRIGFIDVLLRMGADVEVVVKEERGGEPVGDIRAAAGPLRATRIAGDEIPRVIDEIPALAVAAAFAAGTTEVADAAELRVKESDRVGTVAQELCQLGVTVEPKPDGLVITGGKPHAALFKSHGDHRVAMAAAIAANACDGPSTVRGWRAVASSYPGFAADLASVTE
ncbi:MAG TPA: 3-phosphoshikimate 1-carboxyvinyltransferase [Acidimicrobiia bacterium]|nr:3-phosphoshikimate 1-carboxyvinyltransferase [Acidimicrobiia bacterium]HKN90522.1 3-phosphoshikimate 1-carboxyvinyltransferase [Acidimicrobiia bacterium]